MLLTERLSDSWSATRLETGPRVAPGRGDARLLAKCDRLERAIERLETSAAVGEGDVSPNRSRDNFRKAAAQVSALVEEVSQLAAQVPAALKRKAEVTTLSLVLCGSEPAPQVDGLIYSCIEDASRILTVNSDGSLDSEETRNVLQVSNCCMAAIERFRADMLVLQELDGPSSEEHQRIGDLSITDELIKNGVSELSNKPARAAKSVKAKGDVWLSLLDLDQAECLHRRVLALSHLEDLQAILPTDKPGESLLTWAGNAFRQLASSSTK